MKNIYLLSIVFSFLFSTNYAQTTLLDQDFESESTGTIGTSSSSPPYQLDLSFDSDCNGTASGWNVSTSDGSSASCSSCSNKRARISYYSGSCAQDHWLYTANFIPSQSTVSVGFNYGYDDYDGSDYFNAYLLNVTTSSYTTLLSLTSDSENATYSNSSLSVTAGNSYRLVFRYRGTYAWGATVDNILVTEESSDPEITVGSAISSLNYASGSGPSTSQSTSVSGSNLEADITLTAPTNFEISADNSNFYNSLTLSHSGGTVSSTPIHARLKSGLSINSYSGNITASSTNATSKTIALSGTVYNGENSAINYYVDDSGSDSNNGLTDSTPFATLSQAISTATSGIATIINVGTGTYTEHTINVNKTNLIIRGAGSSSTIFDSNTANKGFISITASDVTIEKIKIKDYNFTSASTTSNAYGGAAIRVGSIPGNASVSSTISGIIIKDIIFKDNYTDSASGDGGAIEIQSHASPYSTTTTVTIEGCVFDGNKAGIDGSEVGGHNGGAIQGKVGSHLIINNSVFYDNDSDYTGAAVNIWSEEPDIAATITMNNCTLYDNTAFTDDPGKIAQFYVTGDVTANINNSIIYGANLGNGSSFDVDGQDGHWYYGADYYVTTINMRNSVIGDYSTTEYNYTVSNVNEGSDPLFTSTATDDYTLQDNSPAVDSGSSTYAPSDDLNDLARPQGQADDIGAYERKNTWVGSTDTNWSTTANWSENVIPVSGRSPIIADVTNQPVISSDDGSSGHVSLKDITINSGAELTINKESSLSLSGDFTNNGTVTLNSGLVSGSSPATSSFSSLIVDGTSSGNITYNRYVNIAVDSGSNEWDLVGSPVDGLSISSFVSTNSSAIATSGSTYALGYYDNTNDTWTNYTTSVGNDVNFDSGRGYQMASASGATMAFTGTVLTANQTQSIINSDSNGSSGRRWNLVANPFPSYINLNDNNDASNNFLTVNSSVVDGSYLAVYGYDADGTGYSIYNHAGDTGRDYIAPGQAFFVAAASSSAANISFTTAMRTTSGGDDFVSGRLAQSTHSSFYLKLYEGDDFIADSKFYFDNGLTLGLDPGYDAGALDQNMAIMSRLPQQDQGVGMSINAMGNESFEETTIPLDINKEAGIPFRISLEDATIPEGVEVYLEDTQQQTITDLKDVDFTLTPESDLSGIGRFYVRLGNTNLGNNDLTESHISIYKPFNQDHITIEGLANIKTAKVSLFNIIGQEVLNQSLSSNQSTQTISTNGLVIGVYIVKLIADNVTITKKLIIN